MKIVRIIGGLGNQMFQYAFYLALKNRYENVKLDISAYEKEYKLHNGFELSNIFDLNFEIASKSEINKLKYRNNLFGKIQKKILRKKNEVNYVDTLYHPEVLDIKEDAYYNGYWNSEYYFLDIEDLVKRSFEFKNGLNDLNKKILNSILKEESVSVHVRRGDYLESKINREIYGNICTEEYYEKAIEIIKNKISNPKFYVFSNDIDWCKKNLILDNVEYVDWNIGKESYIDMKLMSCCKHNIIANSSFSWWGAWLNKNPNKKVITPARFFNNVIPSNMETFLPKNWIKIKV